MSPHLIALCGRSGAGKDVVASHFVECHGFRRIAIADNLKELTAIAFGMTRTQLWGAQRNVIDVRWQKTPRAIYQALGDALRAIHPDALLHGWRGVVARRIHEGCAVIVPDIRTTAEVVALRELGGALWRVVRPDVQLTGAVAEHETETTSESFDVDVVLQNAGTIRDLRRDADVALASCRVARTGTVN